MLELYRMPGYLCGLPAYALVAELALCRVLVGSLPRPEFSERLREIHAGPLAVGGGLRPSARRRPLLVEAMSQRVSRSCRSRSWPKHTRDL